MCKIPPGFLTAVPNWTMGETLLLGDGRRFRILEIRTDLLPEMLDAGLLSALLERLVARGIEPRRANAVEHEGGVAVVGDLLLCSGWDQHNITCAHLSDGQLSYPNTTSPLNDDVSLIHVQAMKLCCDARLKTSTCDRDGVVTLIVPRLEDRAALRSHELRFWIRAHDSALHDLHSSKSRLAAVMRGAGKIIIGVSAPCAAGDLCRVGTSRLWLSSGPRST